jgi:uncharacterized protein
MTLEVKADLHATLCDPVRRSSCGYGRTTQKEMTFFFRDATAGHETYGAGRFLEADLPKGGKVVLDFNEAYNPFCAFNGLYICPIPAKENHFSVRMPAGELKYPSKDAAH